MQNRRRRKMHREWKKDVRTRERARRHELEKEGDLKEEGYYSDEGDGEGTRTGGGEEGRYSHWAVSSRQDLYHGACTHTRLHLTYAKRGPRRPPVPK